MDHQPLDQLVSLKGRRAVVTGAASGIGRATAGRFAEAGADLILVDADAGALAHTVNWLKRCPCSVSSAVVNLEHRQEIEAFWETVTEPYPSILANVAGIYPMRDFLEIDAAFLEHTLAVNLEAVLWMCQGFVARRKARGGVIVNVSSIEAILPFKTDLVAYTISKSGVIALTRALARDYGRRGLRANVILPGGVRTPGTSGLAKEAIRGAKLDMLKVGYDFQSRLAMGRWGRADEIARVALFLASDLSSYVQGAVLPVDGGFLSS